MTFNEDIADLDSENHSLAYAEGTPLTWVFGNHPKTKLIAALLSEIDRDINPSDMADLAGVSRSAVYDHLDDLIACGLVEETRTVGPSQMYQLNTDSPIAQAFIDLEAHILEMYFEEQTE